VQLGWNVVYARERTRESVVDALRNGRFYGSTGVAIKSITVDGLHIRVETENARRICALCETGRRFQTEDGPVIEVQVPARPAYVRFECWGDGESFAWTQPFFPDLDEAEAAAAPDFLTEWEVTSLVEHGTLADASPEQAAKLHTTTIQSLPADHRAAGFAEVRRITGGGTGIVYLTTTYESPQDARGILKLGFDGPIRAWVNNEHLFAGPGANPAVPDKVSIYADFHSGPNTITIALDTNNGKAWGVFARVE
jgi:hypothetical protein